MVIWNRYALIPAPVDQEETSERLKGLGADASRIIGSDQIVPSALPCHGHQLPVPNSRLACARVLGVTHCPGTSAQAAVAPALQVIEQRYTVRPCSRALICRRRASQPVMQPETHLEIVPSHRMITLGWSVFRSSLTDS
jgi:hypothetical protein